MNTDEVQAKVLVIDEFSPSLYTFSADMSKLDQCSVLELGGIEWAWTVLHFRRTCKAFNGTGLDNAMSELLKGFDFIIGPIADDRMRDAVHAFANNALTDEGLYACLSHVDHGTQVVAKTNKALDAITLVNTQDYFGMEESERLHEFKEAYRQESRTTIRSIQVEYQAKGRLIDTILKDKSEAERIRSLSSEANILVFDHATIDDAKAARKKTKGAERPGAPKQGITVSSSLVGIASPAVTLSDARDERLGRQ